MSWVKLNIEGIQFTVLVRYSCGGKEHTVDVTEDTHTSGGCGGCDEYCECPSPECEVKIDPCPGCGKKHEFIL